MKSDIARLKEIINNPGPEHRLQGFYLFNGNMDKKELDWQIEEMNRMGIGGFLIHPRTGLINEYLSDDWFDLVKHTIKKARELGMKAWLYDEMDFPSGEANGKVISEMPDKLMSAIYVSKDMEVTFPAVVPIDKEPNTICIQAIRFKNGSTINIPDSIIDVTNLDEIEILGDGWHIITFSKSTFTGSLFHNGYPDTLDPTTVERFIHHTHQKYVEKLGNEPDNNTVPGIFTDEPSGCYVWIEKSLPWTPRFFDTFEEQHKYRLEPYLNALFYDAGDITSKIRCNYYQTFIKLYSEAYYRQIYDFCNKYGWKSIGHMHMETEIFPQIRQHGDFFEHTKYMHYAGIDHLFNQTWFEGYDKWPTNNMTGCKFASSAAHILNKERTLSEAFACADAWKLNMRTLKVLSDWQIALGLNFFVPSAYYYTIMGHRKWDCAPSHFYQSPYWKYYKIYADYMARACTLFSYGRHVADVAVLYPNKSIWSAADPGLTDEAKKIVDEFEKVSELLLKFHRDYDYITEEEFCESDVSSGIIWHNEEYKVLILPSVTTVSQKTAQRIVEFAESGGQIVATACIPDKSPEVGLDNDMKSMLQQIFNLPNTVIVPSVFNNVDEFKLALMQTGKPDVSIKVDGKDAEEIIYLHYIKDDINLYFFSNTSRDNTFNLDITLTGKGVPFMVDLTDGKISRINSFVAQDGITEIYWKLAPTESLTVYLGEDIPDNKDLFGGIHEPGGNQIIVEDYSYHKTDIMPEFKDNHHLKVILDGEWEFYPDKPNAYPLKRWVFELKPGVLHFDMTHDTHEYTAEFELGFIPETLKILLDNIVEWSYIPGWLRPSSEIYINDIKVDSFEKGEYLDHFIYEADIRDMVKPGRNKVKVLAIGDMREPPQLGDALILTGDFAVEYSETGDVVLNPLKKKTAPGSWTDVGLPYYSGTVTYKKKFDIPTDFKGKNAILKLKNIADIAEIRINGCESHVLLWDPWEIDITNDLTEGNNEIEIKVTNSLQNLLMAEPKSSGMLESPVIIIRERVASHVLKDSSVI